MTEVTRKPLKPAEGLKDRLESIQDPRKKEHREQVAERRDEIKHLEQLSVFLKQLRLFTQRPPATNETGSTRLADGAPLPVEEAAQLVELLLPTAPTVAESDSSVNRENMITAVAKYLQKCRSILAGAATPLYARQSIAEETDGLLWVLQKNLPTEMTQACEQAFSPSTVITMQGNDVSARQLTAAFMDEYVDRVVTSDRALVSAELSNDQVAIYDAYQWLRQNSREPGYILPTPYTEAVIKQMNLSMVTRNGLMKYILLGEAGVGKTRLIQEHNRRLGHDTLVINFNYFTSFEDLIAQTVISVDGASQQDTKVKQLERIIEHFGALDEAAFWPKMEQVFASLPPHLREKYTSVENFVEHYGEELGLIYDTPETKSTATDRAAVLQRFKDRMNVLHDRLLLNFSEDTDLKTRYAQAAILRANGQPNMAVCFDELDKAGPQAIEGLLSFLSLSPGDEWEFQGGKVKIRPDFYISATSNSTDVGNVVGSADTDSGRAMNQFLADRCEQIKINNQPTKDALMIAAVQLSDERGRLLLNEREQYQMIAVINFLIPRLREAHISMPVSNRALKTLCSRLVNYQAADEHRAYFRVKGKDGQPQTVAEAVKLTFMDMKSMSMTPEEAAKVNALLAEFNQLLSGEYIPTLSEALNLSILDVFNGTTTSLQAERAPTVQRRQEMVESVWQQPLLQAIARLESELPAVGQAAISRVDGVFDHLYPVAELSDLAASQEPLASKVLGNRNGVEFSFEPEGMVLVLGTGAKALRKTVIQGDYSQAALISADQSGRYVLIQPDRQTSQYQLIDTITGAEQPIADTVSRENISPPAGLVDPLGRYLMYHTPDGWRIQPTGVENAATAILAASGTSLVDLSASGTFLLLKNDRGTQLVDLSHSLTSPTITSLSSNPAEQFRFVGNNIVMGTSGNSNKPVIYSIVA